ncbi:MAG: hypothetical protein ABIG95_01225 [Candidatus Woesearchaeota archaeon]
MAAIKKEDILQVEQIDEIIEQDVMQLAAHPDSEKDISLEKEKNQIGTELLEASINFDIGSISALLEKLEKANTRLLAVLDNEKDRAKVNQRFGRGELASIKSDVSQNDRANKIIEGIIRVVPTEEFQDLKHYLGMGSLGLAEIRETLGGLENTDGERLENIGLILHELAELEKNVREQQGLVAKIKRQIWWNAKKIPFMHAKFNFDAVNNLLRLLKQESEEQNALLREFGYRSSLLAKEKGELHQIAWLEDKQIAVSHTLSLLVNQFLVPSLLFPSGNYATYLCSESEALRIVRNGLIGEEEILPVNKRKFKLAYQSVDLYFIKYSVNSAPSKSEVGFVFPFESVITKRFCLHLQNDMLVVGSTADISGELAKRIGDFDELVKDVDSRFANWIEEAKSVNKRFRENWNQTARKVIETDFTKRWLKQAAVEFELKGNIGINVLKAVFDNAEIERMDRGKLRDAINRSKGFYEKSLKDTEAFLGASKFTLNIGEGVLFLPRSNVLMWESYFEKVGRPNIYYYAEDSVGKAIEAHWRDCKSNPKDGSLPKAKEIEIFDLVSNKPLQYFA